LIERDEWMSECERVEEERRWGSGGVGKERRWRSGRVGEVGEVGRWGGWGSGE
jgi:hypothetical protein